MSTPNTVIEIYSLDLNSNQFVRIDSIVTYRNLSYVNILNDIGRCRFSLNTKDPKASKANLIRFKNHIVIKRFDTIVWFGPIVNIEYEYQDSNGTIIIDAETYLSHFKTRYTDKLTSYVQVDQSDIMWNLIDLAQNRTNGNLKIVRGNNPAGTKRDRTYEYYRISDALINLSNVIGGPDFLFSPIVDSNNLLTGVRFDVFFPKIGNVRNDLQPFSIGKNIKRVYIKTKKDILNNGISEGAGTGTPITVEISYSASQIAYTRREVIYPQKSVSIEETLSNNLNALLTQKSTENQEVELELYAEKLPVYGSYVLGDIVNIDLNPDDGGYLDLHLQARILALEVTLLDSTGTEYIKPTLDLNN